MSISDAQPPDDDRPVAIPRTLSARQERRLADALEARFLDLTRNYKKRTTPASTTPTLHAYLTSAQPALSLILLTPPTSSAHIRTAFLLRHTSDVLAVFPGYEPEKVEVDALIEWCEVVDRGWEAVLKGWRWSAEMGEGVEEEGQDGGGNTKGVSQTDRIRLRSLLLTGTTRIEEWLARAPPSQPTTTDTHDENGGAERADDLEMRARLEALFERSLDALGVDDEGRVEMTDLVPAEVLMRFGDGEGAGGWVEDDDVDMDGETSSDGDESDMERVG